MKKAKAIVKRRLDLESPLHARTSALREMQPWWAFMAALLCCVLWSGACSDDTEAPAQLNDATSDAGRDDVAEDVQQDSAAQDSVTNQDIGADSLDDAAMADASPVDGQTNDAVEVSPWRSALFPTDWKPGFTASSGLGLEDYSYAGYHHGAPIPTVPPGKTIAVNLPATATLGTNTHDLIQAALDQAAQQGGGVVQLSAGTFRVDGRLLMTASHVVLRGKGAGLTRLWFPTHTGMNAKAHLQVGGALKHGKDLLLVADAKRRSNVIEVSDASSLKVGDDVDVGWVITPKFVAAHQMTGTWKAFNGTWQPFFRRAVVAIDASSTPHRITLDVPLRYNTLTRDKASLRPVSGWVSEVGVEALGVSNAVDWDTAWTHNQVHAIGFRAVKDGWIQGVQSFASPGKVQEGHLASPHLQSGGIQVRESKRITITNTQMERAQHRGGGGNGYLFELRTSSEVLTRDCIARVGRHNFIQNWGFGLTGCVWLRVTSTDGKALLGPASDIGTLGYSEFHHSLAMANLVDDSEIDDGWASRNRHSYSTGAGQTATNNVIWRLRGKGVVQSYNFGEGYVIGTSPSVVVRTTLTTYSGKNNGKGTAPEDFTEGLGTGAGLQPKSLYEAQHALRVSKKPTPGN